jgi:glycine cleavage system regulatory protein
MTTNLVLTVIGDDKPGLVESLAQVIARNHGNWLESNMSHLAGKFAGILRVSVDDASADALMSDLQQLSDSPARLKVMVEKAFTVAPETLRTLRLKLVGNDRPGIIKEVSQALAAQHVNVEELLTQCSSAPMSGDMLFHAQALLKVPASLDIHGLQAELERLADDLMVEVNLAANAD